jgi:hypothetical protein
MPFDNDHYYKKGDLSNGDLGGVALDVAIALRAINVALKKLNAVSAADISDDIADIEKARMELWTTFESLTGWTKES